MSENRLFVGNLPFRAAESDLMDYFSAAGSVSSVQVVMDRETGRSRGFAFVEFASATEAENAATMFHNKEFQGRTLTVNIARPRDSRPPRQGRDREG